MPIHHFTLILDGSDAQSETTVDALFEAGCDDALVGRAEGIQYVEFDREAARLDDAVLSAIADVERVPGLTVARIADAGLVFDDRHRAAHGPKPRGGAPSGRGSAGTRRVSSARHRSAG